MTTTQCGNTELHPPHDDCAGLDGTEVTSAAPDALSVPCVDCRAEPGTPCHRAGEGDEPHAARALSALLASSERGTCALCRRPMRRGQRALRGPVVAWHPDLAHHDCPRIPDPKADWNAYATAINLGLYPGVPGPEHFVPAQECDHEWGDNDPTRSCIHCTSPVALTVVATNLPVCPECAAGKHGNCVGAALDQDSDTIVDCACTHPTLGTVQSPPPAYVDPMRPPT